MVAEDEQRIVGKSRNRKRQSKKDDEKRSVAVENK